VASAKISLDELLEHDRLRSDTGRAQWLRLNQTEQAALMAWVNGPRWARSRRSRLLEAVYALNQSGEYAAGGVGPELNVAGTVVDGLDNVLRYWSN
jgi:hypothetical protein